MSIVSLFCEIHDFFMYEAHLSSTSLEEGKPPERRGCRRGLHASSATIGGKKQTHPDFERREIPSASLAEAPVYS